MGSREEMKSCFDIRATATEWINGIQKIMFEFMIYDDWDLVANLSRVWVLVDWENFETLFGNGLMKLRIRFLNIVMLSDFQMSVSRLLHSLIAAGK